MSSVHYWIFNQSLTVGLVQWHNVCRRRLTPMDRYFPTDNWSMLAVERDMGSHYCCLASRWPPACQAGYLDFLEHKAEQSQLARGILYSHSPRVLKDQLARRMYHFSKDAKPVVQKAVANHQYQVSYVLRDVEHIQYIKKKVFGKNPYMSQ